jgi:hypothetical protein
MIITYVLVTFALVAIYLASVLVSSLRSTSAELNPALWIALALALTLILVRPSYSLWLALDFWIDPWEPDSTSAAASRRRPFV